MTICSLVEGAFPKTVEIHDLYAAWSETGVPAVTVLLRQTTQTPEKYVYVHNGKRIGYQQARDLYVDSQLYEYVASRADPVEAEEFVKHGENLGLTDQDACLKMWEFSKNRWLILRSDRKLVAPKTVMPAERIPCFGMD